MVQAPVQHVIVDVVHPGVKTLLLRAGMSGVVRPQPQRTQCGRQGERNEHRKHDGGGRNDSKAEQILSECSRDEDDGQEDDDQR